MVSDATISADRLASVTGCDVHDVTPAGRIAMQRKAVVIPRDVTRSTSPAVVQSLVRGVLADRPQFGRVGIIAHRPHVAAVESLGEPFAGRVRMVSHFGSGQDRSSNAWYSECDLIVIVGTPRVPPQAIRQYLAQVGEFDAAGVAEPEWSDWRWLGTTESGERRTVVGRGYLDDAWQRAHRDLVRAAIVQAVGRGRGILADGCEVVVLTTEECGLPLSDSGVEPIGMAEALALYEVHRLSDQFPNRSLLGKKSDVRPVSTADVAAELVKAERYVRRLLIALERRGLVRRESARGGWLPVAELAIEGTAQ